MCHMSLETPALSCLAARVLDHAAFGLGLSEKGYGGEPVPSQDEQV